MAYDWNYKREWIFQIDKKFCKINYEGDFEKKKYFLSFNGEREEIIIKEDLRDKHYHLNPYKYVFEIDGLDSALYINEKWICLVVEGVDVENNYKYITPKTIRKLTIVDGIQIFLGFAAAFIQLKFGGNWFLGFSYFILIIEFIKRSIIRKLVKKVNWIKDKQGRIIRFNLNELDKIKCKKDS